eukprot:Lankesteria_metandrocarpae@DN6236_c0_g1_i1.p1
MSVPPQKVAELRQFISLIESQPSLLEAPELGFFRDFLKKHGATIPSAKTKDAPKMPEASKMPTDAPKTEAPKKDVSDDSSSEEEDEPELVLPPAPVIDAEDTQVVAETQGPPAAPNTTENEFTDEQFDKIATLKEEAAEAIGNGDNEKALANYNDILSMGNASALLCTRRAELLLKMNRPVAAIKDCDEALKLNPDNGKAYKVRGKANRMLGNWVQAHKDLEQGQKIDYDEDTYEIQKFVDERALKIEEHTRHCARATEEHETNKKIKDIRRRKRRAQKEYERDQQENDYEMPGGMGGMFSNLMSDPEMKTIFENPKIMQAMQDLMSNPGNMSKYKDDPEVMSAFQKLTSKFGGAGMGGGANM